MKKIGNLIVDARYRVPIFIGVLLLAAILISPILKQAGLLAPADISTGHPVSKPPAIVKFCIEYMVNDTLTAVVFMLRNCGGLDVSQNDFDATSYYVNGIKTTCAPDTITNFEVYSLRTITCPVATSCEVGKECTRTIRAVPTKGEEATVTYQYVPK